MLAYKGKVMEWNVLRMGFDLIHRSLSPYPVPSNQTMPLPFDQEEGLSKNEADEMAALYYEAVRQGVFNDLEKRKN